MQLGGLFSESSHLLRSDVGIPTCSTIHAKPSPNQKQMVVPIWQILPAPSKGSPMEAPYTTKGPPLDTP